MTRFQLVFRDLNGVRSEWEKNYHGEPHIDRQPIVDGQTYVISGAEWLVRRDDIGDSMKRFLCTPATEPQRRKRETAALPARTP